MSKPKRMTWPELIVKSRAGEDPGLDPVNESNRAFLDCLLLAVENGEPLDADQQEMFNKYVLDCHPLERPRGAPTGRRKVKQGRKRQLHQIAELLRFGGELWCSRHRALRVGKTIRPQLLQMAIKLIGLPDYNGDSDRKEIVRLVDNKRIKCDPLPSDQAYADMRQFAIATITPK